jgi:predicted dehydrogenase
VSPRRGRAAIADIVERTGVPFRVGFMRRFAAPTRYSVGREVMIAKRSSKVLAVSVPTEPA